MRPDPRGLIVTGVMRRTAFEPEHDDFRESVRRFYAGELTPEDAAMAKRWCTELQGRVVDRCLQLQGGYGSILEYPIARASADARITRSSGGTTEIMKEIVGRKLVA